MLVRRVAVAAAALAAALVIGACGAQDLVPGLGSDDLNSKTGQQVAAAVERFSEATGPAACDMLTPAALRNVYGAKEPPGAPPDLEAPPPAISLAECRRRAPKFRGAKVDVNKVDIIGDNRAAKAEVTSDNGNRTYTITLRRKGSTWLIDEIREK
jgi:hypothetical protein